MKLAEVNCGYHNLPYLKTTAAGEVKDGVKYSGGDMDSHSIGFCTTRFPLHIMFLLIQSISKFYATPNNAATEVQVTGAMF